MSLPKVWKNSPDMQKIVSEIIKETISVQIGDDLYLSTGEATEDQAVSALQDADVLPQGSEPLSDSILPKVALDAVEKIDGGNNGPAKNEFIKRFALMKTTNPDVFKQLGGDNPNAVKAGPGVGTYSPPPGSEWIMNVRGGPQPSIGKGEVLFGMMMGLVPGGEDSEDEADLQDSAGAQYHVKFYNDDNAEIQGPTTSNIETWLNTLFPESQVQNRLAAWIRQNVVSILTTGTTYTGRIESLTLPDNLKEFESSLLEIKAIVAWYVSTAAKMSLVRGETDEGPAKYIVNLIRGSFRVNELSGDLSKQPYPVRRSGDGRISYSYKNGGPVQFLFDNYSDLGRMSSAQVSQLINSINSGDTDSENQPTLRSGTNWNSYFKEKAGTIPAFFKKMLIDTYLKEKNYLVNTKNINAAMDFYVKDELAGVDPIKKFLEDANLSKSAKLKLFSMLAERPADDKNPTRAADPKYLEFFQSAEKINSFLDSAKEDKRSPLNASEATELMFSILEENVWLPSDLILESRVSRIISAEMLINEELTRSDKKEINLMIAKRIEADRVQQRKEFQKNLQKELKSTKFQKAIMELANQELSKEIQGKELQGLVLEITKKVIKKLYRELSYSYNPVIDRIKI